MVCRRMMLRHLRIGLLFSVVLILLIVCMTLDRNLLLLLCGWRALVLSLLKNRWRMLQLTRMVFLLTLIWFILILIRLF